MPLFWLTYSGPTVFISDSGGEPGLIKASIAGLEGRPDEIIPLDAKTARKVPKKMIGKVLSGKEARELLKRIGA